MCHVVGTVSDYRKKLMGSQARHRATCSAPERPKVLHSIRQMFPDRASCRVVGMRETLGY